MSGHKVDKSVEEVIAESQRELLQMANEILSRLSEEAKSELSKPLLKPLDMFSFIVLFAWEKTPYLLKPFLSQFVPTLDPASCERIERVDRLHTLIGENPAVLRCALAVSELSLTFSTLLSRCRNAKLVAEVHRDSVKIEGHPKEFIPIPYVVSRISQEAGASEEIANEIWLAFVSSLVEQRANLPDLKVKKVENDTVTIVLDWADDDDSDCVIIEH